jgi:hypothetical protein
VVAAKVWSKVDADERNVSGKPIVITTRVQWLIDWHLRTTLLCIYVGIRLWHISPTCISSQQSESDSISGDEDPFSDPSDQWEKDFRLDSPSETMWVFYLH